MPVETKPTNKIQKLAKEGNVEALCELGTRQLLGLFSADRDAVAAWECFEKAASAGEYKAEAVIKNLDPPSGDDNGGAMMCNLGKWYADQALDLEQDPTRKEEYAQVRRYAEFWFVKSANNESTRAIYEYANMCFLIGGKDYETAAALFTFCSGFEDEYGEKSLEKLYSMFENSWMRDTWNCYPDALFVLEEYSDHDMAEFRLGFDESTPLDDVTAEAILDDEIEYPGTVEEVSRFTGKRTLRQVLLSLGLNPVPGVNGSFKIPVRGNQDVAQRLCDMGYYVSEGKTNYSIRERKR